MQKQSTGFTIDIGPTIAMEDAQEGNAGSL